MNIDKQYLSLAIMVALGAGSSNIHANPPGAGFQPVSSSSTPVLLECTGIPADSTQPAPYFDPNDNPNNPCQLDSSVVPPVFVSGTGSFPGRSGTWELVQKQMDFFSEQIPLSANDSEIGWIVDRVYQNTNDTDQYILATFVNIYDGDDIWTEPTSTNVPGLTGSHNCNGQDAEFEANDVYRDIGTNISNVEVAWRISPSGNYNSEAIPYAMGRTNQGIAYCIGSGAAPDTGTQTCPSFDPSRDNDRINFRTDISPEDGDGSNPGSSVWYYTYFETNSGVSSSTSGEISVESGGEEGQCRYRSNIAAYEPN